jgi:hypothetical protein
MIVATRMLKTRSGETLARKTWVLGSSPSMT